MLFIIWFLSALIPTIIVGHHFNVDDGNTSVLIPICIFFGFSMINVLIIRFFEYLWNKTTGKK